MQSDRGERGGESRRRHRYWEDVVAVVARGVTRVRETAYGGGWPRSCGQAARAAETPGEGRHAELDRAEDKGRATPPYIAQIFDGSANDSPITPNPTVHLFLTLEGCEPRDELVDRFAGLLQGNGGGELMVGSERVVRGHDGVEDLVPVRVCTSYAPLFCVVRENALLTEDGLDEETEDAVNGIKLGGGEIVVPRTVDPVFREGFPWWNENPVKQTVKRELDIPCGPCFGGVLGRNVCSPAKIFRVVGM